MRNLRLELSLAAVEGQLDEINRNRATAEPNEEFDEDLDDLDIPPSEMPDDPVQQARLKKEAVWLKGRLDLLRKVSKRRGSLSTPIRV